MVLFLSKSKNFFPWHKWICLIYSIKLGNNTCVLKLSFSESTILIGIATALSVTFSKYFISFIPHLLFLPLFDQSESILKFLSILISELKRQSTHKFQQSIFQDFDKEFSCLKNRSWSIQDMSKHILLCCRLELFHEVECSHIFLSPFLRSHIIFPTDVVF